MLKKFVYDIFDFVLSVLTSIRVALFGSEEITPILSVRGILNRSQFLAVVMILSILNSWGKLLHSELFEYFFGLFLFLGFCATIQKRSRDFGSTGTFFVLLATILMLIIYATRTIEQRSDILMYSGLAIIVCFLGILPLFLIPSKKERDDKLCSPLLKYPLLYAVVCCILAVTATLTVSYYTGTEIKLF